MTTAHDTISGLWKLSYTWVIKKKNNIDIIKICTSIYGNDESKAILSSSEVLGIGGAFLTGISIDKIGGFIGNNTAVREDWFYTIGQLTFPELMAYYTKSELLNMMTQSFDKTAQEGLKQIPKGNDSFLKNKTLDFQALSKLGSLVFFLPVDNIAEIAIFC